MRSLLLTLALLLCSPVLASEGRWVTEIGMGWKLNNESSAVLDPACFRARVDHKPLSTGESCGGDNPVFVGWPIAYEKRYEKYYWRVGWFHFSSWFDGGNIFRKYGDNAEVHFNCVCGVVGWTW